MKKDTLDDLFSSLDFDVAEPLAGHDNRFEEKLRGNNRGRVKSSNIISMWAPILSLAAILLVTLILAPAHFGMGSSKQGELASVSAEMAETQNFYSMAIRKELAAIEREKTPETEAVVSDALKQLTLLEQDYLNLKNDLVKSGQDQRVIYAMIANFQRRIDLLNQVLDKINTIKTLNTLPDENNLL